jgi:RNA polymerase sigma-70 factor (ECF subfamily)
LNEEALLDALKNGDEIAFASLVKANQDLVYNTALSMVQSAEDAEDIVQEVFIKVFQSINTFKSEAKLSTWLYRITITKCLDKIKHNKRKKRFAFITNLFSTENKVDKHTSEFLHPGVQIENKERSAVLFKAISQLPANQKIAFTLQKVEGLNQQKIAEVMDTSIASVEAYLHRAKQNLRRQLANYYKSEG